MTAEIVAIGNLMLCGCREAVACMAIDGEFVCAACFAEIARLRCPSPSPQEPQLPPQPALQDVLARVLSAKP